MTKKSSGLQGRLAKQLERLVELANERPLDLQALNAKIGQLMRSLRARHNLERELEAWPDVLLVVQQLQTLLAIVRLADGQHETELRQQADKAAAALGGWSQLQPLLPAEVWQQLALTGAARP